MHPVTVDFTSDEKIGNWRALLAGIMVIPHFFVFMIIAVVNYFVGIIAFFAVLFTKKYPDSLYHWASLVLRYSNRMNAYMMWFTNDYPPFTFDGGPEDSSGYAVRTSFQKPETIGRFSPLYQWFIAIPVMFFVWLIALVAYFFWFLSFFTVLFTGKVPESFAKWMAGFVRANTRLAAYVMFMHNEYPPFSMD